MSQNNISRAAYHNSNGALLLTVNENRKALKAFRTSLQALAQAVIDLEVTGTEYVAPVETGNTMEFFSRAIPRMPLFAPNDVNPSGEVATSATATDVDGKAYIYSKGLVFYPKANPTLVDLAFYSSIVVFNLVLTYHRRTKDMTERDLKKLLALYDMVLKLIAESTRSVAPNGRPPNDCTNLVVATLNNKSVVHSELGQHATARRLLYHVWDVMKYPDRRPAMLETWEVEGFFLNIYLMLVNAPNVAGAA